MAKIVVLGAGGFGISLAIMSVESGHDVALWSVFQSEIDMIALDREHKQKLPGVKIPDSIKLTADMSCISGADIVIIGVPSVFVRNVVRQASEYITENMVIVNTSKGLEDVDYLTMSRVIREEIKNALNILKTKLNKSIL